ncbi:topless-related protein 2-like [Wolffia australiana]
MASGEPRKLALSRDLIFVVMQFLEEEKLTEALHNCELYGCRLEQGTGFFFNMKYFEEKAMAGEWDEVDRYISGFTKMTDNTFSMKIFFEIRKQKYFEALDMEDRSQAVDRLMRDLKVFSTYNEVIYKELTELLLLDNFRENEKLADYGDTNFARNQTITKVKELIQENPAFEGKLTFPDMNSGRLRTLVNQSLNFQHLQCRNNKCNSHKAPGIETLFTDHTCEPPKPVAAHRPRATKRNPLLVLGPEIPLCADMETDATHLPFPTQRMLLPLTAPYQIAPESTRSLADFPRAVVRTINQGSMVTSMDFHPSHHTFILGKQNLVTLYLRIYNSILEIIHYFLLVGTESAAIALWEIALRERLVSIPFNLSPPSVLSFLCQADILYGSPISVTKVVWNAEGDLAGVAFSRHIIRLYSYQEPNVFLKTLEMQAHVGRVNDIAFSHLNEQACVISCGDDKLAIVWDLQGRNLFTFRGHDAPVLSLCTHRKRHIQVIMSTAVNGKIKSFLNDDPNARSDIADAPGSCYSMMLYSPDGSRLFSCGTGNEGDCFLNEWNENGSIKRTYHGFQKKSRGHMQFDIMKNRYLAVGQDHQIKIWRVDEVNMLTSYDAGGGLPDLPCLRFNKEGNLLAVAMKLIGFKILANLDGCKAIKQKLDERRKYSEDLKYSEDRLNQHKFAWNPTTLQIVENPKSSEDRPDKDKIAWNPTILQIVENPKSSEDRPDKDKFAWNLPTFQVVENPKSSEDRPDKGKFAWNPSILQIVENPKSSEDRPDKDKFAWNPPTLQIVENPRSSEDRQDKDKFAWNLPTFQSVENPKSSEDRPDKDKFAWNPPTLQIVENPKSSEDRPDKDKFAWNSPTLQIVENLKYSEDRLNEHKLAWNPRTLQIEENPKSSEDRPDEDKFAWKPPTLQIVEDPKSSEDRPDRAKVSELPVKAKSARRPPTRKIVENPKPKVPELPEISDPSKCRVVSTSDSDSAVCGLLYESFANGLLVLGSDGIPRLWKWAQNEQNPSGKATASEAPTQFQPASDILMTNDKPECESETATPCMAISNNGYYIVTAFGGMISLFNLLTFKVLSKFKNLPPPPRSTCLAFFPDDNNTIAVGMEDASIYVYYPKTDEKKKLITHHLKRITGITFSSKLKLMVSSGADAKVCLWRTETWGKKKTAHIQLPRKAVVGDVRVQFNVDQVRLLAVHETQLVIFSGPDAERLHKWLPQEPLPAAISSACFSCNGEVVYASFCDGVVGIFDTDNLKPKCRIMPSAYLPHTVSNSSQSVSPLVVAANPLEPNQLAVGLTNGAVKVIEPLEMETGWVSPLPSTNDVATERNMPSADVTAMVVS